MMVNVRWSSDGVQLLENDSVIQGEVVEEVIEETLGWREQGGKKLFTYKHPKNLPASLKPWATKSK